MFPYAEFVLYTLGMIAWIEKHPSRKILMIIVVSWMIGKWLEVVTYGRPWHLHLEWTAVLIVLILWAKINGCKSHLSMLVATSMITGQYLFILNEPGIVPYQELLFPLMFILISWLAAPTLWELIYAISGALLVNQILVMIFFKGVFRYLELPEPYFWNISIFCIIAFAIIKHKDIWPISDTKVTLINSEQFVTDRVQLELEDP